MPPLSSHLEPREAEIMRMRANGLSVLEILVQLNTDLARAAQDTGAKAPNISKRTLYRFLSARAPPPLILATSGSSTNNNNGAGGATSTPQDVAKATIGSHRRLLDNFKDKILQLRCDKRSTQSILDEINSDLASAAAGERFKPVSQRSLERMFRIWDITRAKKRPGERGPLTARDLALEAKLGNRHPHYIRTQQLLAAQMSASEPQLSQSQPQPEQGPEPQPQLEEQEFDLQQSPSPSPSPSLQLQLQLQSSPTPSASPSPSPSVSSFPAAAAHPTQVQSRNNQPSLYPLISSSKPTCRIVFSTWDVSSHVFLTTPHTYGIVNLKPLSPGHVLLCPRRVRRRFTDLTPEELTDIFSVVQVVQRMLARKYFPHLPTSSSKSAPPPPPPPPEAGCFNIAIQDGAGAGQTVPHVHVHVIPRIPNVSEKEGDGPSDEIYEKMAREDGNIGGALWDQANMQAMRDPRPVPGGMFDRIEDAARKPRELKDMEREAEEYRNELVSMGY